MLQFPSQLTKQVIAIATVTLSSLLTSEPHRDETSIIHPLCSSGSRKEMEVSMELVEEVRGQRSSEVTWGLPEAAS